MGFNCGIVGLPNVGKSTLFNALVSAQKAEAENYPFCTIEPNVGRVSVPDNRLDEIAAIASSEQVIHTQLEFVDIAGLVKGASKGEGLGNQFLSHIREVDAICYMLRCFEDGNITHVEGGVDPVRDAEIIETELILADMESLEKRVVTIRKKAKSGDKEAKELIAVMEPTLDILSQGKPARMADIPEDAANQKLFKQLHMLTAKPVMYVANVDERAIAEYGNPLSAKVEEYAKQVDAPVVLISARIESEISAMETEEEKRIFLASVGTEESGLEQIIRTGYRLLDLVTFFTAGPKEARAWTVRRNAKAPEAAGVIHTDFERGFIRAEIIGCDDYLSCGGESRAKEAGKMRLEGSNYVMQDGDIAHFRFNV